MQVQLNDRIVSRVERRQICGFSDAQVDRMEAAGLFPRRIKLGPGRIGWSMLELQAWIAEKKAARDAEIGGPTDAAA